MTGAISLSLVTELFNYNYWARDRQLEVCALVTEDQFLRHMGSSFPSIRDTLAHLVGAEWLWLERWRGRSPRSLLSPEEFPTLVAVSERWYAVEAEMRSYLASLTDEALAHPVTYLSTRGQTWTYPLWRTMLHLLNHQSYHRGQVSTLLRQSGIQPPEVDLLVARDIGVGS